MTTISIKELHAHTGEWVRKAGAAGGITVTDRGRAVAVLQALSNAPAVEAAEDNPWRNWRRSPELEALQSRMIGGTDSTDIISEMRGGPADGAASGNPFLTRKLLPGFHELQKSLTGGTDSTDIISEMREGR